MPKEAAKKQTAKRWLDTGCLRSKPTSVDLGAGILHGVKVCTEGEAKGHGVSLESEFIETVAKLGNQAKQGLKARFGHPNMCSESMGTFVGRFKNFSTGTTVRTDGTNASCCFADLHLSESAKDAPGGDLYAYVVSMAENEADMFGTSIVFRQGNRYRRNSKGEKVYPRTRDGILNEEFDQASKPDFIECAALMACDCVDDPAANDGLFSAFSSDIVAGQITEFLDLHPQVFHLLENSPEVMAAIASYGNRFDEFLSKYREYRAKAGDSEENLRMKDEKKIETTDELQTDQQKEGKTEALEQEDSRADVDAAVKSALQADRKRQKEIRELGAKFGFTEAAEQFAESGQSVAEFQAHILNKSPEDWKASLSIKNPATQESEEILSASKESNDAVSKIKDRRQLRFGSK